MWQASQAPAHARPPLPAPARQCTQAPAQRLAAKSKDPDFGQACLVIHELMAGGGQARWLTAHMDAGSGMNDLARVASERDVRASLSQLPQLREWRAVIRLGSM